MRLRVCIYSGGTNRAAAARNGIKDEMKQGSGTKRSQLRAGNGVSRPGRCSEISTADARESRRGITKQKHQGLDHVEG